MKGKYGPSAPKDISPPVMWGSTPEGGPSTPVFKCEVIEEGNTTTTQQFINKQKKYFVEIGKKK